MTRDQINADYARAGSPLRYADPEPFPAMGITGTLVFALIGGGFIGLVGCVFSLLA